MNIMLVEDDAPLAMGMEYTLKKHGFMVTVAKNIKEAHTFFNNKTDLILLDVTLPDGNGYDFCKQIRTRSDIPVIFMTALDDETNVVFGLDIGGDDYIAKPVRTSELISRINAVMRRQKSNNGVDGSKVLISRNVVVEPLKCKVSISGEEVNLTAVEYKLLLLLLENKGSVLSRNVIIEKIWDIDGNFVDYNTLNVYMKRLREKIEIEDQKHIETIRGLGYMWRDEEDKS